MKIIGVDYSINSPAAFKFQLSKDLKDIENFDFIGFSTTKRLAKSCANILYYDLEDFQNQFERIFWFRDHIYRWMNISKDDAEGTYIGIEGYAMGAKGRVFDIAEATFSLKEKIYLTGVPLRIYAPTAVKKHATGNGRAKKGDMSDCFDKTSYSNIFPGFSKGSPREDIIDAFFVAQLLIMELRLKKGVLKFENLTLKQKEIFKNKKVDLIKEDFIINNLEEKV